METASADTSETTHKSTATLDRPAEPLSGPMKPTRYHLVPPSISQASSSSRTWTLNIWKTSSLGSGAGQGGALWSRSLCPEGSSTSAMLCMLARPLGRDELAGLGGGPASGSLHDKLSDQTYHEPGLGELRLPGAQLQREACPGPERDLCVHGSKDMLPH